MTKNPHQKPTYEELEQRIRALEADLERERFAGESKARGKILRSKQAEEELQAKEVFLYRLIDQSPFATWISDAEGTLQRANPALKKFLNLTDEQLVGKYNVLQDPLAERQGLLPLFRTVFEQGQTINFSLDWDGNDIPTLDLRGSNRVSIEATMFPIHNSKGELTNVVLNWVDVTDHKQAETELRSEKAFTDAAINALDGIFYVFDEHSKMLQWNKNFETVSGYSGVEIAQMNPVQFFPLQERPFITEKIQEVFTEGRASIEANFMSKDESTSLHLLTGARFETDGVLCLVGTGVDISKRREAENALRDSEELLDQAQKVESVGRLAGGVAHDLNNLLSPILGFGELLLGDLGPHDARRESVNQILGAGLRARDLVRQLLAFSRKQTLEYKSVDLNQAIIGFEKLLRRTIREDIAIQIVPSAVISTIRADIGQIEQVIMNIAVNAQDAMPEGGTLTIETAPVELDEAYAARNQGVQPGSYTMLTISDTGHGMDEETRKNVFEPFFSTKGERGTGLGLATVYGIVKQHGGNVWVNSEPGRGTAFKIYLKVSEQEKTEDKTGQANETGPTGSEAILLVEDDEAVRGLVLTILKRLGYTVLVAENGPGALKIMEEYDDPVRLLLTDVVMPEMNGKELFAKAKKRQPDLGVLYMSGYTKDVIAVHGVLDEGVPLIRKPFTVQSLAINVREALEAAQPRGKTCR